MVVLEEGSTICIVRNTLPDTDIKKISLLVRPSYPVSKLFHDIKTQFDIEHFELTLQAAKDSEHKILNEREEKTLEEVGVLFHPKQRNTLIVGPCKSILSTKKLTKLPMEPKIVPAAPLAETNGNGFDHIELEPLPDSTKQISSLNTELESSENGVKIEKSKFPSARINYVGLVNQAMTCYLNSLLQALFMTPEFRNALYNWEFDGDGELKSIPYQLQKLFLKLQTSTKIAIETTDLTKSFGWDYTEAWQQHDVQELCRVMFDALEQKFKNTDQSDLINKLYEGKMNDFVKCLECCTENTREDTFLDIPLPLRAFGSNVTYNSIEEALAAFVQAEKLDGNNQYFCSNCDKKCDAYKGLKFKKFPYILTLHLKRFDFDYRTFKRIKLNDKVTFPQILNLNDFISESESNGTVASKEDLVDNVTDGNISSSIDPGSNNEKDISNGCSAATSSNNNHDDLTVEHNGNDTHCNGNNKSGPYLYELFAIMIHSGSATGGHYYAYIKELTTNEWYCFNDQLVSLATQEDINKSFGGDTTKAYYSGAYSSSTNAYMVMYRQIDASRNVTAIKVEEFPEHINHLLVNLREKEITDQKNRISDTDMVKFKVYFWNPQTHRMKNSRVYMPLDSTLEETLEDAHSHLKVGAFAPIECCRIVAYKHSEETIIRSYEGHNKDRIDKLMMNLDPLELLLEIRDKNTEFEVILPGGVLTNVFKMNIQTCDIDGPISVRGILEGTVAEYKQLLAKKLSLNIDDVILVHFKCGKANIMACDSNTLQHEEININSKIFVILAKTEDMSTDVLIEKVERCEHLTTLYFVLPTIDKESTTELLTPDVNGITNGVSVLTTKQISSENKEDVTLPLPNKGVKKNIVKKIKNKNIVQADIDKKANPPIIPITSPDAVQELNNDGNTNHTEPHTEINPITNYFRASSFEETSGTELTNKILKVLVDSRMSFGSLKQALEPHVNVSHENFKIFRLSSCETETECINLKESIVNFKDSERLIIKLGRALKSGEYKCKIYYMKLSEVTDELETIPFIYEWIIHTGATVSETKNEILTELISSDPKYNTDFGRFRLRKKNGRMDIYLESQIFGDDVILTENSEFIVQELDDCSQPYTNLDDRCLFVRKWNPSKMTLGCFEEILVTENSELKNLISLVSGIPEENIEYAKLNGSFSRCNISVLNIHTTLTWCSKPVCSHEWPLNMSHTGDIYFYKEKDEPLKELTTEERHELSEKERLSNKSCYSLFNSTRREKALKIYLDSPMKSED